MSVCAMAFILAFLDPVKRLVSRQELLDHLFVLGLGCIGVPFKGTSEGKRRAHLPSVQIQDTIFAIFSFKSPPNTMVTPSQQWQTTHDSAVLPIWPIFSVRSPDPFLTIFAIFSVKSPPNINSGQGIHIMRVQRAFSTCSDSESEI